MAGREDAAKNYLTEHRIPELIQNITSALVYDRPGKYFSMICWDMLSEKNRISISFLRIDLKNSKILLSRRQEGGMN